jgi:hypothetical protein
MISASKTAKAGECEIFQTLILMSGAYAGFSIEINKYLDGATPKGSNTTSRIGAL